MTVTFTLPLWLLLTYLIPGVIVVAAMAVDHVRRVPFTRYELTRPRFWLLLPPTLAWCVLVWPYALWSELNTPRRSW